MFSWKTEVRTGQGMLSYGKKYKVKVLKFFGFTIWTKRK